MQANADLYLQAISTVGFPIVAFLLMYRFATNAVQENTKAVQDLEKTMNQLVGSQD